MLPPAAREVPGGGPAGLGLVLAPSWPRGISCAGLCGMCRGGHTATRGWGTRPAHPRGRAASVGATAEAAGRWVSSRGRWPRRGARGCRERVSTDLSSAGRKEGRKRGRLEVLRSFLRRAGRARASRDAALCPPLPRGPRLVGSGDVPPARVCSHRQRHGLWCGASRSPQRGVTGRAPLLGLARGLKINACECPVEAEAACTIGGNASACKHCFAADTCFLRPAVGTLILQTQRGSGAAPQPPREPGRALASPQPNQGHRQRVVALGRLGDTRHRWLSPGPLPASVARHCAASLPQPRGSRGSPHGAAELGWGLRAARQHQQPRGCPLFSLPSPSPALMLPLSQERL